MSKKKNMLFALSAVVLIVIAFPMKRSWDRFWAVDACVDRGGRFNRDTGKCEFFDRLNIMSVVLIGQAFEGRYSITMEIASPDALAGAELALEHADKLGYSIIGVREVKVKEARDSCQNSGVLKTYDRVFSNNPDTYK